jgi:hypothetical protein
VINETSFELTVRVGGEREGIHVPYKVVRRNNETGECVLWLNFTGIKVSAARVSV